MKTLQNLDNTKIDWYCESSGGASMIKVGVYPEGTTKDEIEKKVKGTFGGKFLQFGSGKFRYRAYTD